MKTATVIVATTALAVASFDSTLAMRAFLQKLPNGNAAFTQELGHVGETDTLNDFGNMFSKEGNEYTATLCKATFPNTAMTVGQAFGDPCCTWKAGGKPDFTVDPFTVPAKKTECASAGAGSNASTPAPAPAPGSGSSGSTPGSGSSGSTPAPAPTTTSPSAGSSSSSNSTTPAPAAGPSAAPPGKSPKVHKQKHKCHVKKAAKAPKNQ